MQLKPITFVPYVFGGLALLLLVLVADILLPFVVGLVAAYLLYPARQWLDQKVPTHVSCLLLVSAAIGTLLTILFIGAPLLAKDVMMFTQKVPAYAIVLQENIAPMMEERFGIAFTEPEMLQKLLSYTDQIAISVLHVLEGVTLSALALFDLFGLLFITPLVMFYMLLDWEKLTQKTRDLLPSKHHKKARALATHINARLANVLRGQIIVSLIMALIYAVAFSFIDMRAGFLVGLSAGLLSYIPVIGWLVGLGVALLVAAIQLPELWVFVALTGCMVAGKFIMQDLVLTPFFVERSTRLHPLWVVFATLAGGKLAGALGVLVALPLATVLAVVLPQLFAAWHNSVEAK